MLCRLAQLFLGLGLFGVSIGLMVRAGLGLGPWSVFHQGLADQLGLSIGLVTNAVGALTLLLWIPLRQRPGIGTVANVLVIGTVADLTLWIVPPLEGLPLRTGLLLFAIALNGVAGGMYIGAGLGPGPRDGLMTGIVRLTGWRVAPVRTGIELTALAFGWLLGGTVGLGTVIFAFAVGPLVGLFLPVFDAERRSRKILPVNP
ncbi:hypothetical protein [uncultured Phenylobacterium sp.]|uniref:membrane protein YczE n=1 Tax=uncultured Phenylobacterium sp. TaxID=349273 RepID=UPI0025E4FF95|nr:hypothetical protein [uncultured Phenylobacterium sp.]